jgi:hypothetical protein
MASRQRGRKRGQEEDDDDDDASMNEEEFQQALQLYKTGKIPEYTRDLSVPAQCQALFARLEADVFAPERAALTQTPPPKPIMAQLHRVRMATVQQSTLYRRVRTRMATVHTYIRGITQYTGGDALDKTLAASCLWQRKEAWEPMPIMTLVRLFQSTFGLTFDGVVVPLPSAPATTPLVFLFESVEPNMPDITTTTTASSLSNNNVATDALVLGVMCQLPSASRAELLALLLQEEETKTKPGPPACQVLPRLWLLVDEPELGGEVAMRALKAMNNYEATQCSIEACKAFKEKARLHYENVVFMESDIVGLTMELRR